MPAPTDALATWDARGVLDLLDAAYDVTAEPAAWLARLAAAAARPFDASAGLQAFEFDLGKRNASRFGEPVLVGGTDEWRRVWRAHWWDPILCAMEPAAFEGLVRFGPTSVTSALFVAVQQRIPSFRTLLERRGREGWGERLPIRKPAAPAAKLYYPDSWNVVGLDASGLGVALVANRTKRLSHARSDAVELSERVGAHLAAAVRLRARLAGRAASAVAEAVLTPAGKVVHADGAAKAALTRHALRDAVATIDRLRAAGQHEPGEHALGAWPALHRGRYTLVDEFERDGRHFVVACPNAPEPRGPGTLTPRERQVVTAVATGCSNKIVAYELGISTSTVAALLRRARQKLGVGSRAELIARAHDELD